jgi:hypothetical protein
MAQPRVALRRRLGSTRLLAVLLVLGLLLLGCSRDDADDELADVDPEVTETDAPDNDGEDDDGEDDDGEDDGDDADREGSPEATIDPDAEEPGTSADDPEQPEAEPGDGAGQDGSGRDTSAPAVEPGPAGLVTIDGQGIAMQEARRCESMDAQNIERDLDLRVIGERSDGRVQLDIVVEDVGGMPRQALSLTLPDGRVLANDAQDFGSGWEDQRQQAMPGPPIRVSGGTALVDWVVYDPVGDDDELAVRVEVEVPQTTSTCR